jgi:hypothetical protein
VKVAPPSQEKKMETAILKLLLPAVGTMIAWTLFIFFMILAIALIVLCARYAFAIHRSFKSFSKSAYPAPHPQKA